VLLPRSPEPQEAVQAEERKAAGDQHRVEAVHPPEDRAPAVVTRIRMRIVPGKAGVHVGVAPRARLDEPLT